MAGFTPEKISTRSYEDVLARILELMLPCNVVVFEGDDGKPVVLAIDPTQMIAAAMPAVRPVADIVKERLARVLSRLD